MKHTSVFRIIFLLLFSFIMTSVAYQTGEDTLELSVAENLSRPAIPKKAEAYIRTSMDQLRRHFVKNNFEVSPMRNGEVLRITLPCDTLFGIGSTELKPSAINILRKFSVVVREPNKYKVLITVHTDDTGDDVYADSISAERANAIDDGLWQIAGEKETNVIPYGIGKEEPLYTNDTRANRALNRRVEFFIVPDQGLIDLSGVKRK